LSPTTNSNGTWTWTAREVCADASVKTAEAASSTASAKARVKSADVFVGCFFIFPLLIFSVLPTENSDRRRTGVRTECIGYFVAALYARGRRRVFKVGSNAPQNSLKKPSKIYQRGRKIGV
jgi:hypothetical protein